MIQFKSLKQYTHAVDGIRFPQSVNSPFLLVYLSENSNLINDYPKLNLHRPDFRFSVVPITKIPRTKLDSETRKSFKDLGLLSYSSNMSYPKNKNILYDLSTYLKAVDSIYKPLNYRQRSGFLIKNLLMMSLSDFNPNYQKVLIYSIDATKNVNKFMNRKIFPIMQQLKKEEIFFDHLILAIIGENKTRYRLLIKNKDFNFTRILQYVKNIKSIDIEEIEQDEVNSNVKKTINVVGSDFKKTTNDKIKGALEDYLEIDKDTLNKIDSGKASSVDLKRATIKATLYKLNGDLDKSNRIVNSIKDNKLDQVIKVIDRNYADDLLAPQKTISSSNSELIKLIDVAKLVDNKSPEHLFEKRKVDFETNLKKDLINSFKVLESKEIPLKIKSLTIIEKDQRRGEILKSDTSLVKVVLIDKNGNLHNILIEIPKIDPTSGIFRVYGEKKCLINQIVLNPISFPKPFDSKFESSFSKFHIYSKRTKRISYLETYMGSFKLPFSILLFYSFGFENTMKQYKINYEIVNTKPKKDKFFAQISGDQFMIFKNADTELKKELCNSLINSKIFAFNILKEFGSKDYFNSLIFKITGRINATYLITTNLENIIDPVVKQVLLNKQLPTDLKDIMHYMASKVVLGYTEDRNDITNQRIRNAEVLVHLTQKQILSAYTDYKEQILSGNKDAKFNLQEGKVLSQFVNLEVVQSMEYANPVEEMSVISRVSPVGKSIGGIPDKRAIQLNARNVHGTYFGNIDPLDTPEGGNVGIVQQLTIDAHITSSRGLIAKKDFSNKEYSGMLSTSTALIPFIENNEGARIMMAANQARQMVPLKNPTPPIVQSGYESILTNVLSDSFVKKSPCNGKISNISKSDISIDCNDGKKKIIDISPVHLKSGSGKNTLSTFVPSVIKGQRVKEKQIIAEGSCVANGSISLGRTLCCAYMPYKGYNFEDGIVINEKLVSNDSLTSLHGIEEEIIINEKDKLLYIVEIGSKTKKGEPLLRKTIGELDELIGMGELDEDENIEIAEGQFIQKSPGGTIVDIEVFSNLGSSSFPKIKDLSEKTNKKYGKPDKEKFVLRGIPFKGIMIKFKIEQELQINLGDKLCNRYGNKGIISLIEKDELMPRTPWGEKLDIIFNPLGVLGRMNIGQMYEMYCGLISRKLAEIIVKTKDQKHIAKVVGNIYEKLDTTNMLKDKMVNRILGLNSSQFKNLIEQSKKDNFVPIIIPPFKAPTNKNISEALKALDLKTTYKLKLPEFNTMTKNPVPVGYVYMAKLEHIGEMKIHSRSTGPVVGKTRQPAAGKRRLGGQRMGEGDTWALLCYNCPLTLSEFFGPLSDDHVTKQELITDAIQKGEADFRVTKTSPTKDLLNSYFISLMLGD